MYAIAKVAATTATATAVSATTVPPATTAVPPTTTPAQIPAQTGIAITTATAIPAVIIPPVQAATVHLAPAVSGVEAEVVAAAPVMDVADNNLNRKLI